MHSSGVVQINKVVIIVDSVDSFSDSGDNFAGVAIDSINGNNNFVANARIGLAVVNNSFAVLCAGNAGNIAAFNVDNHRYNAVRAFCIFIYVGNSNILVGGGIYCSIAADFEHAALYLRNSVGNGFIVLVWLEGYSNNHSNAVAVFVCRSNRRVGIVANRVFAVCSLSNDGNSVVRREAVERDSFASRREFDIGKTGNASFSRDSVGGSINSDKSCRAVGIVRVIRAEDSHVSVSVQRQRVDIASVFFTVFQFRVVVCRRDLLIFVRIENVSFIAGALINLRGLRFGCSVVAFAYSYNFVHNEATVVHAVSFEYTAFRIREFDSAGNVKTGNARGFKDALGTSLACRNKYVAVNAVANLFGNGNCIAAGYANCIAVAIVHAVRILTDHDCAFCQSRAESRRIDCQVGVVAFGYSKRNAINRRGIFRLNRRREVNVDNNGRNILAYSSGYINRKCGIFVSKISVLVNGIETAICRNYVCKIRAAV